MTVNEIRESGILEQYALGLLSDQQVGEVEGYLTTHPVLQQDYFEIQNALQAFAFEHKRTPRPSLEQDILDACGATNPNSSIPSSDNLSGSKGGGSWKMLSVLFGLIAISSIYFLWNKNSDYGNLQSTYTAYKLQCDSIAVSQQERLDLFYKLTAKENRVLSITPTEAYPNTQLLFHFNPTNKENFIQIQNLPTIASNQAFQLWSLKAGVDPIPLTVFKGDNELILPVDFEPGTGTYAITIEAEGGASSPTLDQLIGTVTI